MLTMAALLTSITADSASWERRLCLQLFEWYKPAIFSQCCSRHEKPSPREQLGKATNGKDNGVTGGEAVLSPVQRSCSVIKGGHAGNGIFPSWDVVSPFVPHGTGRHSWSLSPRGSCDMGELSFRSIIRVRNRFSYLWQPAAQEAEGDQAHRFDCIITKYCALNYVCSGEGKESPFFFPP